MATGQAGVRCDTSATDLRCDSEPGADAGCPAESGCAGRTRAHSRKSAGQGPVAPLPERRRSPRGSRTPAPARQLGPCACRGAAGGPAEARCHCCRGRRQCAASIRRWRQRRTSATRHAPERGVGRRRCGPPAGGCRIVLLAGKATCIGPHRSRYGARYRFHQHDGRSSVRWHAAAGADDRARTVAVPQHRLTRPDRAHAEADDAPARRARRRRRRPRGVPARRRCRRDRRQRRRCWQPLRADADGFELSDGRHRGERTDRGARPRARAQGARWRCLAAPGEAWRVARHPPTLRDADRRGDDLVARGLEGLSRGRRNEGEVRRPGGRAVLHARDRTRPEFCDGDTRVYQPPTGTWASSTW